jgi:hypothetical protein
VTAADDLFGYRWLASPDVRPGSWMAENGSCFTFLRGLGVDEVVASAGLDDPTELDLTGVEDAAERFIDAGIAVFRASDEWTVFYEANGYPELFANDLIVQPSVTEAVVAFWNVNFNTEFSYWQSGSRIVTFEFPDQRGGTDPDRLLPAVEAVGILSTEDETVNTYPARMLALAEHITGIHLGADFLSRRLVASRYNGYDD